ASGRGGRIRDTHLTPCEKGEQTVRRTLGRKRIAHTRDAAHGRLLTRANDTPITRLIDCPARSCALSSRPLIRASSASEIVEGNSALNCSSVIARGALSMRTCIGCTASADGSVRRSKLSIERPKTALEEANRVVSVYAVICQVPRPYSMQVAIPCRDSPWSV